MGYIPNENASTDTMDVFTQGPAAALPAPPLPPLQQQQLPPPHPPPNTTPPPLPSSLPTVPNQINTALTNKSNNYHTNTNYDHSSFYAPKTPSTPATPATPATPLMHQGHVIKVKIKYGDEIFAIKVPIPITIELLRNKIIDRIGFEVELFYSTLR